MRSDHPPQLGVEPATAAVSIVTLEPTVRTMSDLPAMEVLAGTSAWGMTTGRSSLACAGRAGRRRQGGRADPRFEPARNRSSGADVLDRRMAHALHRLALESQVLLTDAWPGAFDDRVIAAIRTVQEGVERVLSGEDIRYYPSPSEPSSERP